MLSPVSGSRGDHVTQPIWRLRRALPAAAVMLAGLTVFNPGGACAGEEEDESAPKRPNIYLDFSTAYASLPPNTLAIGFRNFVSPIPVAAQVLTLNAPLTVDLTDRISVYGGVSSSVSRTDLASWGSMTLDSWNVGFNADVIKQDGAIPTVTVISTLTRSITSAPGLGSTSNQTVVEFDYALDDDATRGLLAGTRLTSVWVDSDMAKVEPTFVGYLGGYYQWPSNWKLSGRLGVQSFGGASFSGGLLRARSFTQPTVRFDLDRMDDNDNRLYGAALEIAWTPAPIVQLTLRTPIYAVRN